MGQTQFNLPLSKMSKICLSLMFLLFANQSRLLEAVGLERGAPSVCPWDYDDFCQWGKCSYTCGSGKNQAKGSPINIVTSSVTAQTLTLTNPDTGNDILSNPSTYKSNLQSLPGSWARKGFTFQLNVDPTEINGAKLRYDSDFTTNTDDYELLQVHYHWGKDNNEGSEHTVDGIHFPLEAHFVHGNTKYHPGGNYTSYEDGLLVIGVLYQIDDPQNPQQVGNPDWIENPARFAKRFANQEYVDGDTSPIAKTTQFHLWKTLNTALTDGFYSYKGSLTTPGCQEVVTWIVAKNKLPVRDEDLKQFRRLIEDSTCKKVKKNWRHTQDLGGRTVFVQS